MAGIFVAKRPRERQGRQGARDGGGVARGVKKESRPFSAALATLRLCDKYLSRFTIHALRIYDYDYEHEHDARVGMGEGIPEFRDPLFDSTVGLGGQDIAAATSAAALRPIGWRL